MNTRRKDSLSRPRRYINKNVCLIPCWSCPLSRLTGGFWMELMETNRWESQAVGWHFFLAVMLETLLRFCLTDLWGTVLTLLMKITQERRAQWMFQNMRKNRVVTVNKDHEVIFISIKKMPYWLLYIISFNPYSKPDRQVSTFYSWRHGR